MLLPNQSNLMWHRYYNYDCSLFLPQALFLLWRFDLVLWIMLLFELWLRLIVLFTSLIVLLTIKFHLGFWFPAGGSCTAFSSVSSCSSWHKFAMKTRRSWYFTLHNNISLVGSKGFCWIWHQTITTYTPRWWRYLTNPFCDFDRRATTYSTR